MTDDSIFGRRAGKAEVFSMSSRRSEVLTTLICSKTNTCKIPIYYLQPQKHQLHTIAPEQSGPSVRYAFPTSPFVSLPPDLFFCAFIYASIKFSSSCAAVSLVSLVDGLAFPLPLRSADDRW